MSTPSEIIINGVGSFSDFGLRIASRDISYPSKKKIIETIPYASSSFDFSYLNDEQAYNDRMLKYSFHIIGHDNKTIDAKTDEFVNWINGFSRTKLIDTNFPGYYFLAECIESEISDNTLYKTLTLTFAAYPYKLSAMHDGNDIWDSFNFNTDVFQNNEFTITEPGTRIVLISTSSTYTIPEITTDRNVEVSVNGVSDNINTTNKKYPSLRFKPGENRIIIKSPCKIKFEWWKAVL